MQRRPLALARNQGTNRYSFTRVCGTIRQNFLLIIEEAAMNYLRLLSLAFLIFYNLTITEKSFAQEKINLTNGEWPPYLSSNLPHNGMASHIVSRAFEIQGVHVKYGFFPWKRSLLYAKREDNEWHGSIVWSLRDDRAESFLYSDPVITTRHVLFHHIDQKPIVWESIEDLRGKAVGLLLGSSAPTFEDAEKNGILTIWRFPNLGQIFGSILRRRVDIIPMVQDVGRYQIRKQFSK